VLLAVGEHVLDEFPPVCKRMGTGFFGGLGGTRQEACGALTGGVLVIGAMLGRIAPDEDDRAAMNLSALYRSRFLGQFGEIQCAPLRECVLASEELGSCGALVEESTRLLLTLFDEVQELGRRIGGHTG
jgi:C_GCAxxG_C_C family probable redox protein